MDCARDFALLRKEYDAKRLIPEIVSELEAIWPPPFDSVLAVSSNPLCTLEMHILDSVADLISRCRPMLAEHVATKKSGWFSAPNA